MTEEWTRKDKVGRKAGQRQDKEEKRTTAPKMCQCQRTQRQGRQRQAPGGRRKEKNHRCSGMSGRTETRGSDRPQQERRERGPRGTRRPRPETPTAHARSATAHAPHVPTRASDLDRVQARGGPTERSSKEHRRGQTGRQRADKQSKDAPELKQKQEGTNRVGQ